MLISPSGRRRWWMVVVGVLLVWAEHAAHARDPHDYKRYRWNTGSWGVCWSERGCGVGSEERTVWCGDSLGRPLPPTLCRHHQRPPNSRPCYRACSDGSWVVGEWSSCLLEDERRHGDDDDGLCRGHRIRNITCQVQGDPHAPHDHCNNPTPITKESCRAPCPQDCVMGPWSTWAPCQLCESIQSRIRAVLVAPSNGGAPCTSLSESRPCTSPCTPALNPSVGGKGKAHVKLRVGEWGPCKPLKNPQEDVTNVNDNSIFFATNEGSTFNEGVLSDAESHEKNKVETLDTAELNLIDRYDSMTTATAPRVFQGDDLPNVGRQERSVTCVHLNGTRLPIRRCLADGDTIATRVRTCVVDRDCVVTQWTSWSTLVPGCVAPSGLVVREVRERRRTSLALQQGQGVPCPHLLERHTLPDPSLQPCDTRYQWVSSAWGPCTARVGSEESPVRCGGGVQNRQLTCVRAADHVPVADDLCVHVEPPPRVQRCEVGCERDCVVGPWSAWGVCTPTDCTASPPPLTPGFQRRRREVVVTASPGGAECPPLEEQSECHGAQCHQWVMSSWSICCLGNSAHSCGPGLQIRNASCIDSAGASAPREECEQELGVPNDMQDCHVPCAFDCVVGMWSSWSPCSRPCASQFLIGYTQRNTSIVAPPGPGGMSCPAPDEMTQVVTCREEPCGGAAWVAGSWGECSLPARAICGPGRQTRSLDCRDYLDEIVPAYKCGGLKRPILERSCEVSCGTDCTVTSWSEWSPCLAPDPCPMDVLVSSVQRRWRRVLVFPSEGGMPCPPLEEERGCAHAPVTCTAHHWRTGPWSRCILADDVECGTGFRVRSVECVDASGKVTEPTECLLGDSMVPEASEECQVWCQEPCITSAWTSWTPCPTHPPCSQTSTKRRKLLDGSASKPECEKVSLQESSPCACHTFYKTTASAWSSCLVGDGEVAQSTGGGISEGVLSGEVNGVCGVGKRYRALLCTRDDGALAHPKSCGHTGVESEPCMVECPSDCRVDPWGPWSTCNATCGAGIQHRTRKVLDPSLWGGRPCPETTQIRACWGPCSSSWVPSGWSECHVINKQECGAGTQIRTVRCMKETLSGLQKEVSEEECDPATKPQQEQACHISCAGECVVSSWAPWSPCPQGCPQHSHRNRSRTIVRRPVGNVATCPTLAEEEPCLSGVSCWQYAWHVANWTSCVPLGQSSCGEGVRNRPVTCIRSDGIPVPDWQCSRDTRPSPLETWCYVDCPIDCEVSPWTQWDDSKCSCGENPGEMTRRRFLSVNPSESGRSCPIYLQQSRPCPALPCYTWERGPWSQCYLQGGGCGHGYVERNVSCVGPGGQTVDPQLCLALIHVGGHTWPYLARALDLNIRDGCYVPCEGDCELTEWASWSHCHRDCSRGHQGGTQTRSRAILSEGSSERVNGRPSCPGPLWETRPCLAGPCLNFTWEVRNNTVDCVRSDGLIVTGGCEGTPRPCVPECSVRGSLCSAVGTCVCRPGFRPRYSEKQRFRLTACTPVLNLTFPLPQPLSEAKYLPEDINVWMFAMVGVGSAFLVFVVISMYLLCQIPPSEQTTTPLTLRRQKTLRHRPV